MAASLLGIFTGSDGQGAETTGSRTTTAGTLITIGGAAWLGGDAPVVANTDSKSNTYTEPQELTFDTDVVIALSYNMAGTRGTSHTCTCTPTPSIGAASSVTAQEWDGVANPPTVASATNTGTASTAISVSVAVGAASLAVGLQAYNTTGITVAPNGATQASEQDEDNTNQEQNVSYKVTQTGTPSIDWTASGNCDWGAIIVTFTEAGGATAVQDIISMGFIPFAR